MESALFAADLAEAAASPLFESDRLIALLAFALVSTWTPGPNNIMLTNSGAAFGFARTMPHALGVAFGFPLMLFLIALGLGELFQSSATFREALRWVGAAVLLYLGWRIATAGRADAGAAASRPFTFFEAAGFQWINPKAWAMAIGVSSTSIAGGQPVIEAAVAAAIFAFAGLTSSHSWALFGVGIRRFLATDARLRAFNIVMGALLAGCVVFLFVDA